MLYKTVINQLFTVKVQRTLINGLLIISFSAFCLLIAVTVKCY